MWGVEEVWDGTVQALQCTVFFVSCGDEHMQQYLCPAVSPSNVSQDDVTTKLTYLDWPADNVTVTISIVS